jgi:hypothetical protein
MTAMVKSAGTPLAMSVSRKNCHKRLWNKASNPDGNSATGVAASAPTQGRDAGGNSNDDDVVVVVHVVVPLGLDDDCP